MKKKYIIIGILVVVILGLGGFLTIKLINKPKKIDPNIGYIGEFDSTKQLELKMEDKVSKVVSNELIITFKDSSKENTRKELIKKYKGTIIGEIYILNQYQVRVETESVEELQELKDKIKKEKIVSSVILNYINENEISYNKVGSYRNEFHIDTGYHLEKFGITEVYDKINFQNNIKVGIFDAPIDYTHPVIDIKKEHMYVLKTSYFSTIDDIVNYLKDYDHESDSENKNKFHVIGSGCEYLGFRSHGTHVAGIIGAKHNDIGINGINDHVELYYATPWYYFKNDNVDGRLNKVSTIFSNIYALTKLIAQDVRIINMSVAQNFVNTDGKIVSIKENDPLLEEWQTYFDEAFNHIKKLNKDFLIVKGAGNDSTAKHVDYITEVLKNNSYTNERTIVVGATDVPFTFDFDDKFPINFSWKPSDFSNYGDYVDIFAPGSIYSAIVGNDYEWMDGTSQATPVVTGIASLLLESKPNLTANQLKNILINHTDKFLTVKYDNVSRVIPIVSANVAFDAITNETGNFDKNAKSDYGVITGTFDFSKSGLDDDDEVTIRFTNNETNEMTYGKNESYYYSAVLKKGKYNVEVLLDDEVLATKDNVEITEKPLTLNLTLENKEKYKMTVYAREDGSYCTKQASYCNKVGMTISTEKADAKVLAFDSTLKNYILYNDKNLKIYDIKRKKKLNIKLENTHDYYTVLAIPDIGVYGIVYGDKKSEYRNYYDVISQEKMYVNKYSSLSGTEIKDFIVASKYDDGDYYTYLLSTTREEEVLKASSDGSYITFDVKKAGDEYFIFENEGIDGYMSNKIYSYKKEEIASDIASHYQSIYKDNLYLFVRGEVKKFNSQGTLSLNSKDFDKDSAKQLINNCLVYVDNNKLKLYNVDTKKDIEITNWQSSYNYDSYTSGYYDKERMSYIDKNKPTGIYLVIYYASKDSKGNYGMEYCYTDDGKIEEFPITQPMGGRGKPVLYLYPPKETKVKVEFEHPEYLTTTYPKYKNKWEVTAKPNGDLYDKDNKYYYALYWDEVRYHEVDFSEGFYVTKDNAINFLEEKLKVIGFNPKEMNEFIMYWLPILESNEKSLVYFELTDEREEFNKLIINPAPDSMLRVTMHVKKVDKETKIKEQKLETFKRYGFSAVEWGGMVY